VHQDFFRAFLQNTATHCNTLQQTASHCNTLQHLQHTATHCNTHCNTHRVGALEGAHSVYRLLHSLKTALYSLKRVLHSLKIALHFFSLKIAPHSSLRRHVYLCISIPRKSARLWHANACKCAGRIALRLLRGSRARFHCGTAGICYTHAHMNNTHTHTHTHTQHTTHTHSPTPIYTHPLSLALSRPFSLQSGVGTRTWTVRVEILKS